MGRLLAEAVRLDPAELPRDHQRNEERDGNGDAPRERLEHATGVLRATREGAQRLPEAHHDCDQGNDHQLFHFTSPLVRTAASSRFSRRTVATTVAMATPMTDTRAIMRNARPPARRNAS